MKFDEKNSCCFFFSKKWKKKHGKKNDKKDMLKMVDVSPKSCLFEAQSFFAIKSVEADPTSIGWTTSSVRNLGSAMVKNKKGKTTNGTNERRSFQPGC